MSSGMGRSFSPSGDRDAGDDNVDAVRPRVALAISGWPCARNSRSSGRCLVPAAGCRTTTGDAPAALRAGGGGHRHAYKDGAAVHAGLRHRGSRMLTALLGEAAAPPIPGWARRAPRQVIESVPTLRARNLGTRPAHATRRASRASPTSPAGCPTSNPPKARQASYPSVSAGTGHGQYAITLGSSNWHQAV